MRAPAPAAAADRNDRAKNESGALCVDKREVDFVLMEDEVPVKFIECKLSKKEISPSLRYLKVRFPEVEATQVVMEKGVDLVTKDGVHLRSAHSFLNNLI